MIRVELEIHDDAITAVKKIRSTNDNEVELFIPKNSVLFENVINLKIIQNMSENLGISTVLNTDDDNGNALIESLNGQSISQSPFETEEPVPIKGKNTGSFMLPMPKLRVPKFKVPKIGLLAALVVIGGLLYFGVNYYEDNTRNAQVNIIVDSQELTRSLTIRIKGDSETKVAEKILKGETVAADIEEFAEMGTTGEKTIGEKAGGKIKIYNRTENSKKLNEGTKLYYDDLEYLLVDTVDVPGNKLIGTTPDGDVFQPGEKEAEIIAKDIGPDYNIDKDSEFDVDDYKSTQVYAAALGEIDGGKLEKIKVVSQEDLDNLKKKVEEQSKQPVQDALRKQVVQGKELIKGSETTLVTKETFSKKLDDESDKLTLTQTISSKGLVYKREDIDAMIEELVKDLIPEGFELSDQEKEVNIEILGESTDTVLSFNEADIQLSVKSFVIAKVDEESLREQLNGKTLPEAQDIIRKIQNVKNFSINIYPNVQFLNAMPRNKENIEIKVERQ